MSNMAGPESCHIIRGMSRQMGPASTDAGWTPSETAAAVAPPPILGCNCRIGSRTSPACRRMSRTAREGGGMSGSNGVAASADVGVAASAGIGVVASVGVGVAAMATVGVALAVARDASDTRCSAGRLFGGGVTPIDSTSDTRLSAAFGRGVRSAAATDGGGVGGATSPAGNSGVGDSPRDCLWKREGGRCSAGITAGPIVMVRKRTPGLLCGEGEEAAAGVTADA